jgi:hypothetical protein
MDDQPAWINRCIIRNDLLWKKSEKYGFSNFLKKYTLNDSYWIGIFHNSAYDNSITLAIEWDADCLSEDLKSCLTNPDDWLYLFIRITDVKQVAYSGYKNKKDIQRGIQRSILKSELKSMGKDQLLVISDKYGGNVKIIFNGECRFLVLDEDKQIIRL